jgi:hypothetical protein
MIELASHKVYHHMVRLELTSHKVYHHLVRQELTSHKVYHHVVSLGQKWRHTQGLGACDYDGTGVTQGV